MYKKKKQQYINNKNGIKNANETEMERKMENSK